MDISAEMTTATGQMIDAIGEAVTYTAQNPSVAPASIKALFDSDAQALMLAGIGEVSSYKAIVSCKTSDVPSAKKNDLVTARSVNYTVTDVNPDGTGLTVLVLTKA